MDYENIEVIDQAANDLRLKINFLSQQATQRTVWLWHQDIPHPGLSTIQAEVELRTRVASMY